MSTCVRLSVIGLYVLILASTLTCASAQPSPALNPGLLNMVLDPAQIAKAHADLAAELARIKAAGEPVTLAEMTLPEVPDVENAATLYQQAFPLIHISEGFQPEGGAALGAGQAAPVGMVEVVAQNAEALRLLAAAAQRPKCRFPVDWSDLDARFPHHSQLLQSARLLLLQMQVLAQQGDMVGAMEAARAELAAGDCLCPEPFLGQHTCHAIHGIMWKPLNSVLASAPVPQAAQRDAVAAAYHRLFDYLGGLDFNDAWVHGLLGTRANGIELFDHLRQHPEDAAFLTGDDTPELVRIYSGHLGPALLDLDELYYLRQMKGTLEATRLPLRERSTRVAQADASDRPPDYALWTTVILSHYAAATVRIAADEARAQLAQVALALRVVYESEGKYPATLADLRRWLVWKLPTDPFTDRDLVYRPDGQGYVLYSVGPDLKDDGGAPLDYSKIGQGVLVGDIVWKVP